LNVDGAFIARLLFDATEHEFYGVLTTQNYQKLCTRVCSRALNVNILVRIWIILSTSFEKQDQNRLNPSNDLRVALSNCVLEYKHIIPEKQ